VQADPPSKESYQLWKEIRKAGRKFSRKPKVIVGFSAYVVLVVVVVVIVVVVVVVVAVVEIAAARSNSFFL
jgi:hypothetical protein